jgi:hypothetical protein
MLQQMKETKSCNDYGTEWQKNALISRAMANEIQEVRTNCNGFSFASDLGQGGTS